MRIRHGMVGLTVAAMSAAAAGQVTLRGGERVDGTVAGLSVEGVKVTSGEGAAATTTIIGWDRVRFDGLGDGAAQFHEAGDGVWRARTRLERGDWPAAEALFEGLFQKYRGMKGPTAAVVDEGTLRCRLARGASAGSVWAWLEWMGVQRAVKLEGVGTVGPHWVGGKIDGSTITDEKTGLVPLLPPIWLSEPAVAAAAASEEWNRYTGSGVDSAQAELAGLYRAAARFEAGLDPELPTTKSNDEGARLVRAIVEARVGDEGVRAAARAWLKQRAETKDVERWVEAWCRAGLGRSMVLEQDPTVKRLGVIELLHLPARFSSDAPYLAGVALAEACLAMKEMGEPEAAKVLRWDLETRFPRHPALGWTRLRELPPAAPPAIKVESEGASASVEGKRDGRGS